MDDNKLDLILIPVFILNFKSKSKSEIDIIFIAVRHEAQNIAQQILGTNENIQLVDFMIFNDVVVNGLFLTETS